MLRGVDVSVYQGPSIDWSAVKAAGREFAFCKASEGMAYADPTFGRNFGAIRSAGLARGAYHYGRVWNDPAAEARYFLSFLPVLRPGDMLALDLETGTGNLSNWALTWLSTVERAVGFKPLLYTYPDFVVTSLTDARLAAYPLWLADLSGGRSSCLPWLTIALRQYTWTAAVPGIPGPVDGDELARDMAGLLALGKPAPAPLVWRVKVSGRLKQAANHISDVAIGPDHTPYPKLPIGRIVVPTGAPVHTDDTWQAIRIPGGPVHGWYPAAALATSV